MKIVVGGIKGGSGKTTIATNIAVCLADSGKTVLLVDADEQRSASDWADQRENYLSPNNKITTISLLGKSIRNQIEKLAPSSDCIIVDTGGRDTTSQRSALTIADKFIIPFKPRSFDIWTVGKVKQLIEEIHTVNTELLCYSVINQGDSKGFDNGEAMEILSEIECLKQIPVVIGHRKAFANAASEGLGVIEMKKKDNQAVQEIKSLLEFIT